MPNNAEKIEEIEACDLPALLKEISDPPKKLHIIGALPKEGFNLCVVGSRKPTPYGRQAVESIITGLRGHPINIISGLAMGVDTLAHEAALSASLTTVAVPGSGLNKDILYPSSNRELARRIVDGGGALISEFDNSFRATPWSFPQRNRIMAGLSNAVLLVEAEVRSGTLITARLAADYNRDVLAIPGSIFSSNSKGTNMFIRLGATAITSSTDILEHFGINVDEKKEADTDEMSEDELLIWEILKTPTTRNNILATEGLSPERANIALSLLELKGYINEMIGLISRK